MGRDDPPTPDQIVLAIQKLLIEQGTLVIGDGNCPLQILEIDGNKLHFRLPFGAEVLVQISFPSFGALVDPEVEQELRQLLEEYRPGVIPAYTDSCGWHGQCWALEYPNGRLYHHCTTIQELLHVVRSMLATKLRTARYHANPKMYERRMERVLGLVLEGLPNREVIPIVNQEFPDIPLTVASMNYFKKRAKERLAILAYISRPLVGLIESRIG